MADVTVDIDLSGVNAALGAAPGFLGLTDNRILSLNGHPVEIFHHTVDGDGQTDAEFVCNRIQRVMHGFIFNVTDDAFFTAAVVGPKDGAPGTAVATGDLTASKVYLVFVVGGETR